MKMGNQYDVSNNTASPVYLNQNMQMIDENN